MKRMYIDGIREKDKVEDTFLVTKKESGMSKSGKAYLNLKLMDRTGDIDARVWDNVDVLSGRFNKNDFVKIKGFGVSYQSNIQVNVVDLEMIPQADIDLSDFLPASERDPDRMLEELDAIIDGLKNHHLKGLLKSIFTDREVRRLFKTAPAAKKMHHSYIGGLLEHVLSLCGLVKMAAGHYRNINADLIIAGAILHDIGKIYELSYDKAFDYTDEGRLLGHITIGVEVIEKEIAKIPDFPKRVSILLKHMLLSHHGYLEFGSPKRPKTVEAVILYYCDDLDSKVQSLQALIEKERDTDSNWTSYHRLYERYIYKGDQAERKDIPKDSGKDTEIKGDKEKDKDKDKEKGKGKELNLFK
ncbi:MAG: HD domain-containing protein [Thermodesulfobacteriota bacterium]